MNVYVVLMIVTIIYLVFASITDLKERMIYTSPIAFLHMAWSVYFYMNLDICEKRELEYEHVKLETNYENLSFPTSLVAEADEIGKEEVSVPKRRKGR